MIRLALLLLASPALAQEPPPCAARAMIVGKLASEYGETQQWWRLSENGTLTEGFASADTGTWTDLVTAPGQPTCIADSGYGWTLAIPTAEGSPL